MMQKFNKVWAKGMGAGKRGCGEVYFLRIIIQDFLY
jgi:hypothetical protein